VCRLNTEQLPVQHALLPGNTLLPSSWELPYGFMEPFFRRIVIPLMDTTCVVSLLLLNLHTQVNTVLHAGAFPQQISDDR
jgi:hypothetical protein